MAMQTSILHIQVDDETREKATLALDALGLSMDDAVRLFLRRIIDGQALPFALKVPNAETRAAMREADDIVKTRAARFATADALFENLEKAGKR